MRFRGTVRGATTDDLPAIATILEAWFVGRYGGSGDEVDLVVAASSESSSSRQYLVAELDGRVIGVMGVQFGGVDHDLVPLPDEAIEIMRAYVAPDCLGVGAGTALTDAAEELGRTRGFGVVVVVSGARNRDSGYWFWDRRYGARVREDPDYFAPGAERVVWTKKL